VAFWVVRLCKSVIQIMHAIYKRNLSENQNTIGLIIILIMDLIISFIALLSYSLSILS